MRLFPVRCVAALFAYVPLAVAAPAGPAADPATLAIDAGRLDVMMDQSTEALRLLAPNADPGNLDTPDAQRAYAFQELVSAVLRYNAISDRACRQGLVSEALCGGPYLPVWLSERPDTARTDAALRAMIDDAAAQLTPFWAALCEKGRKAAHDDTFCAIE